MCAYIYIYRYAIMYVCIYVCLSVYVYTYTHTYFIRIRIHACMHTQRRLRNNPEDEGMMKKSIRLTGTPQSETYFVRSHAKYHCIT